MLEQLPIPIWDVECSQKGLDFEVFVSLINYLSPVVQHLLAILILYPP